MRCKFKPVSNAPGAVCEFTVGRSRTVHIIWLVWPLAKSQIFILVIHQRSHFTLELTYSQTRHWVQRLELIKMRCCQVIASDCTLRHYTKVGRCRARTSAGAKMRGWRRRAQLAGPGARWSEVVGGCGWPGDSGGRCRTPQKPHAGNHHSLRYGLIDYARHVTGCCPR